MSLESKILNPLNIRLGKHYDFIVITGHNGTQRETGYLTQFKIQAIEIEDRKYHSWLFCYDSNFKKETYYNQYSKRDQAFAEDCYSLNKTKYCFALQKKM